MRIACSTIWANNHYLFGWHGTSCVIQVKTEFQDLVRFIPRADVDACPWALLDDVMKVNEEERDPTPVPGGAPAPAPRDRPRTARTTSETDQRLEFTQLQYQSNKMTSKTGIGQREKRYNE